MAIARNVIRFLADIKDSFMFHFTIKYQCRCNRSLSVENDLEAASFDQAREIANLFAPDGFVIGSIKETRPPAFHPELCEQLQFWVDGKKATEILKDMNNEI